MTPLDAQIAAVRREADDADHFAPGSDHAAALRAALATLEAARIDTIDAALKDIPAGWHAELGWREQLDGWGHCVLYEFPPPCRRIPSQGVVLRQTTVQAIRDCIAMVKTLPAPPEGKT